MTQILTSLSFLISTILPVRSTVLPQKNSLQNIVPVSNGGSSNARHGGLVISLTSCVNDILDGNTCNNDGDNGAVCSPLSNQCQCSPGFEVQGFSCRVSCSADKLDGNPCNNNGDNGAICSTSPNLCLCSPGWVPRGGSCVDLCQISDSTDRNPCNNLGDNGAKCGMTTTGDYTCFCSKGWQFIGGTCSRSVCVSNYPEYTSICNELGDTCATCEATSELTHVCSCSPGWESIGGRCSDIDECKTSNVCGCGTCHNVPGDYFCTCNKGYKVSADGKSCYSVFELWLNFLDSK